MGGVAPDRTIILRADTFAFDHLQVIAQALGKRVELRIRLSGTEITEAMIAPELRAGDM